MAKEIKNKHYHAGLIFLLSLASCVLLIVSNVQNWYEYSNISITVGINITTVQFFNFSGVETTTTTSIFGERIDTNVQKQSWSQLNSPNTQSLYQTIQSFVTIATITTGVVCIGLVFRFMCRCFPKFFRRVVQMIVFFCCCASPILIFVAWVLLFHQPSSLTQDNKGMWHNESCDKSMCGAFMGKANNGYTQWGPYTGWWMVFGAFFPAIINVVLIIHSRQRYKYMKI